MLLDVFCKHEVNASEMEEHLEDIFHAKTMLYLCKYQISNNADDWINFMLINPSITILLSCFPSIAMNITA